MRTDTKPLKSRRRFSERPIGAVFGDHFLYQNVISSNSSKAEYLVDIIQGDSAMEIWICPNPDCGASFPPRNDFPEKFCTDCGTVLERGGSGLLLVETVEPIPEPLLRIASKGLSHGSVRAPLAVFDEQVGPETRHCLVSPYVPAFLNENPEDTEIPSAAQALRWGGSLARGMDYLHDNGVFFDGKMTLECIGLILDRAVWADFRCVSHHPEGYVLDRGSDTLALARLVYRWLSGKNDYDRASFLKEPVKQAFDLIFQNSTIRNGSQLAALFQKVADDLAPAKLLDLLSGRRSDVGMVRDLNEDSLLVLEMDRKLKSVSRTVGVYVVADGMGGHSGGEVASGLIVDLIAKKASQELLIGMLEDPDFGLAEWLKSAVEAANLQVYNLRKSAGTDMGSTLVAAVVSGDQVTLTHIGDSRAYQIHQNQIRQLTIDHSLVERMVANHQITREEARRHPQRNVIYRTMGDKPVIEIDVEHFVLSNNDTLLLCSDGLSGYVDDEEMRNIVLASFSPQAACDALIKAANAAGGDDNISVIIIQAVSR